ncbi:MAG: ATP-binding protein [Actinomycetota bacterium]
MTGRVRLWPDSIVGRTVMVLLGALAVSLAMALYLFADARHQALAALGGRNAAERVAGLVALAEQTPPDQRRQALHNLDNPRFRVGWGPNPLVVEAETDGLAAIVRPVLERSLEGREIRIAAESPPPPPAPGFGMGGGHGRGPGQGGYGQGGYGQGFGMGGGMHAPFAGRVLRISVRLQDDSWLNVLAPLEHGDTLWRPRFVAPLLLALLVVTAAALWAVRRATRPFAAFATAAERLGVDVASPPLPETGPREVRQAALAFNVMQGRIRRFVEDRTQMLAAISHDLRTPITRLRLRAEFVDDDEQRAKMLADLEEMEAMIAATLAFARDDAAREPRVRVDVASLVQGLVEDMAAAGAPATYQGPDSLVMEARPSALKRALANLVDNGAKYGGAVRVSLSDNELEAVVALDDDGPGIAEADAERVFAPFVRLEGSRSRDTGGTGLGLAVARAAVRAHGGDIRLTNRAKGGLRVTVTLPKA